MLVIKDRPLKANLCEFSPWDGTTVAHMRSYEDVTKPQLSKELLS